MMQLKGSSVKAPFASGASGPPVRAPHPMGDYRIVPSEAGLNRAFARFRLRGDVYATGLRVRHGPAPRQGSVRMRVIRHCEAA